MILPIRTDSPLRSTPWTNWAILLLNVAVFFCELANHSLASHYWLSARDPKLLHFFSYAFLHGPPDVVGGWAACTHLVVNMLALYIFGNNVNDCLGNLGYLAFYLCGAAVGGMSYVLSESSPSPVVGASGAVMAVMGAYLALYPRSRITILSLILFVGTFEIPSLYFMSIVLLLNLLASVARVQGIAYVTHVGGMLFGFGLCMALLWAKLLPRDPFDFLALVQRWNRRRQYQTLVRRGYNPFGYIPPAAPVAPAPAPPDPNIVRLQQLRADIHEAVACHNLPHAAILFLDLKRLDRQQVLSRQAQLDVANQLTSQQFYAEAADAYEQFLSHYPNFQQVEHVELMLGVIYNRYLHQYQRAQELLTKALQRLHAENDITMARREMERIAANLGRQTRPEP